MKEQVLNILTELCPGIDFEHETALIYDGLVDSLDIVSIVSEFMAAFDVELSVEYLQPENFNTVDAMVEMIQRAQG